MPDNRALEIRKGSGWASKKTGITLVVLDYDITYEGDVLLSVSVEGGSRQLMEYSELMEGWWLL